MKITRQPDLMIHSLTTHDLESSHPEDVNIKPERLPVQILAIKFDLGREGKLIASVDLRPSGKARDKPMNPMRRPHSNQILLVEERGTRSHKTLVSRKDAEELRQLVQACSAEKSSKGGQVEGRIRQQMSGHLGGVDPHTAQFRHPEEPIVLTHTIRPIEYRTMGRYLDKQSENNEQRK